MLQPEQIHKLAEAPKETIMLFHAAYAAYITFIKDIQNIIYDEKENLISKMAAFGLTWLGDGCTKVAFLTPDNQYVFKFDKRRDETLKGNSKKHDTCESWLSFVEACPLRYRHMLAETPLVVPGGMIQRYYKTEAFGPKYFAKSKILKQLGLFKIFEDITGNSVLTEDGRVIIFDGFLNLTGREVDEEYEYENFDTYMKQ